MDKIANGLPYANSIRKTNHESIITLFDEHVVGDVRRMDNLVKLAGGFDADGNRVDKSIVILQIIVIDDRRTLVEYVPLSEYDYDQKSIGL